MKKKILAIALAVVILATAAVAATLAWFTDTEADETTVTVGNIQIDLSSLEAESYTDIVPGELPSTNIYNYTTTVTNTGINDAWVRVKVLIPAAIDDAIHLAKNGADVKTNATKSTDEVDGYVVYTFTKVTKLTAAAGAEHSFTPVTGFYLDSAVDCDDEGAYYLNGKLIEDLETNVGKIIVKAEAIQETGFTSAEAAFEKFDAQVTGTAEVDGTTPELT